jgi:hypothetical protein
MEIRSNTIGKLRKIYDGRSFSDRIVIISEMFQNAQRAKATRVDITIGNGEIVFADNGCGCDDPQKTLTLDLSSWKTTDEGFGIGLWSWLAVPEVEQMEICSQNWKSTINVKDLFESKVPQAHVSETVSSTDGFKVVIKSPYFTEHYYDVEQRIVADGELQLFDVYLNGVLVPRRDLHAEVYGDFVLRFQNNLFDATLSISQWGSPMLYYEKRPVQKFYLCNGSVEGVVELKKNALTLQEPDRKNVIYDTKRERFSKKLQGCAKELYIEFVKIADNRTIDKYAESISRILEVKDYEKYILTDDMVEEWEEQQRNIGNFLAQRNSIDALMRAIEQSNKNRQMSLLEDKMTEVDRRRIAQLLNLNNSNPNVKWVAANEVHDGPGTVIDNPSPEFFETVNWLVIGGRVYRKVNIEELEQEFEQEEEVLSTFYVPTRKQKKQSLKDAIKRKKKRVWVKASEAEEYKDLRAKAEYYGIKVFVANNILHENVFEKYEVPYISELEDSIQKRYFVKNVGIRTKKEKYFIELLRPICEFYNIPKNTFLIGNLKLYLEMVLRGQVVNREIIVNRRDEVGVEGVCQEGNIILDRHAINLSRFNLLGNGIGINEIKAIMANLELLSHELAHLIYNTEDNTEEHFKREREIQREIVNLYLTK